jgi:integrase
MARHASQPQLKMNAHGYYGIFWTENGRSKRITTGKNNHVDAAVFYAHWLQSRYLPAPVGGEWNISMLLDSYYAEQIDGGPTRDRTRIIIATLKRAFGTSKPESLDAAAIMRYTSERGQGLHGRRVAGESTVRRELTVLIAALNHAVRQRRIRQDQFPHIDRPDDGDARDVVIPQEHMDLIFASATGRLLTFVTIAYETAQRRGAIENLRWGQILWRERVIDFAASGGRGSKGGVMVPISDRLMSFLVELSGGNEKLPGRNCILWHTHSIYPAWVALMGRLATQTGSDAFKSYVPHDLRRTWATRAAQRGVDLWSIAGVLGDSLAVVTKHYAKHQPEHLRKAMNPAA